MCFIETITVALKVTVTLKIEKQNNFQPQLITLYTLARNMFLIKLLIFVPYLSQFLRNRPTV